MRRHDGGHTPSDLPHSSGGHRQHRAAVSHHFPECNVSPREAASCDYVPVYVGTDTSARLYGILCLQSYMYFRNADNLYRRTKFLLVTASALILERCGLGLIRETR